MLAQHFGIAKLGVIADVLAHDRRPGLQRAPGRGVPISAEANVPNNAGLPADAGLYQ